MTLCIGIDPGGTTGLAAVEYTEECGYHLLSNIGVSLAPDEVVEQLYEMLQFDAFPAGPAGPWWIAAERFVVSRRAGRSSAAAAGERARNILGALEAAFPRRVKLTNASAAKGWATDTRLRAAGLWPAQGHPHTTDAARHALRFLVAGLGCPDPLSLAYPQGGRHGQA